MKLKSFFAEDKVLRLIFLGILIPVIILILMVLFNFLGIKFFSNLGSIFNYLVYIFAISLSSLAIYIPFFKKTQNPRSGESKVLIILWILVSVIASAVTLKMTSSPGFSFKIDGLETLMFVLSSAGVILFMVGIPFFIINLIMGRVLPARRQVILFSIASILISSLVTAVLVYSFKPSKISIEVYPWDLKDGAHFSCSTKIGATLFPKQNYEEHTFEGIDGALFTNDKTKMAIEIDGKVLKMITAQSVEVGHTTPAELVIVRNNENELIAIDTEEDIVINQGVGTFVLNKKKGLAVWTKSKAAFFTSALPETQAYYMECR